MIFHQKIWTMSEPKINFQTGRETTGNTFFHTHYKRFQSKTKIVVVSFLFQKETATRALIWTLLTQYFDFLLQLRRIFRKWVGLREVLCRCRSQTRGHSLSIESEFSFSKPSSISARLVALDDFLLQM